MIYEKTLEILIIFNVKSRLSRHYKLEREKMDWIETTGKKKKKVSLLS